MSEFVRINGFAVADGDDFIRRDTIVRVTGWHWQDEMETDEATIHTADGGEYLVPNTPQNRRMIRELTGFPRRGGDE